MEKKEPMCLGCGMCCTCMISLKIEGLNFLPFNTKSNKYPFTCEHFDFTNNKCKVYGTDKRKDECREWYCNGNPRYREFPIEGKKR